MCSAQRELFVTACVFEIMHMLQKCFNYSYRGNTSLHQENHWTFQLLWSLPIYLFKVDSRSTRMRCEIRSKLTIKTPERHQLTLLRCIYCKILYTFHSLSSFCIVDLEQAIGSWAVVFLLWRYVRYVWWPRAATNKEK